MVKGFLNPGSLPGKRGYRGGGGLTKKGDARAERKFNGLREGSNALFDEIQKVKGKKEENQKEPGRRRRETSRNYDAIPPAEANNTDDKHKGDLKKKTHNPGKDGEQKRNLNQKRTYVTARILA